MFIIDHNSLDRNYQLFKLISLQLFCTFRVNCERIQNLRGVSFSWRDFDIPQDRVCLDHPVQVVDDVSEVVEKKASVNVVARTCKLTDTTLSEIVDRIQHRKPRGPRRSSSPASSFARAVRVLRFAFVRFTIVKLGSSFHGLADNRIQRRVIPACAGRDRFASQVFLYLVCSSISIFTWLPRFCPRSFSFACRLNRHSFRYTHMHAHIYIIVDVSIELCR